MMSSFMKYAGVASVVAITTLGAAARVHASEAAAAPTFTRDVLPILQGHCQDCHRPKQIAPMSLLEYDEVRPWAKAIRQAVTDRTMPPFHAEAPLGMFDNDTRLTPEQIETVARWVDSGAPRGNPADAPPPVEWPTGEWTLGTPDIILEFPSFTSKPNNLDEEVVLFSDHVFTDRTWVQAFEFKTSNHRAVHHAGVFSVNPEFFVPPDLVLDAEDEHIDKFEAPGAAAELIVEDHMFTWLPGQRVQPWAEGAGVVIRKNHRLVIQAHVPPMEEAIPFTVSLGIWLVNGEMNVISSDKASLMFDLVVPAQTPSFIKREKLKFNSEATVYGYTVHMHLRGKSSQILFHYPDGTTETAFNLPRYNFDWQRIYWLAEPKVVPKDTEIEYIAEWDNSADNPLNPDPTVDVPWGGRTTDEMYGGHVYYSIPRKSPVTVRNGLNVSSKDSE